MCNRRSWSIKPSERFAAVLPNKRPRSFARLISDQPAKLQRFSKSQEATMPSQSGKVYGLTLLCPILDDPTAIPSHDLQIRGHLAELSTGPDSPFAIAPGTHLARLVVLDDVIYVGMPAREDHLKSKYLVFES